MEAMKTDTINEIESRTLELGGRWGVNHAKRLLAFVERLAGRTAYDRDIVHLAAYMHDWGGWEPWKKADTDHALRSFQIIPGILRDLGVDAETAERVADCALRHHDCDASGTAEAVLLHDADALDFTGATGILRNFSMTPRDLRAAVAKARMRIEYARDHLVLEKSREIAPGLIERSERILTGFEEETGGFY